MKKNKPRNAFTITEILVTIGIMSFIVGGILMGIIQMGRNVEKTRNYNFARKQLSTFVQGFYSFTNKSFGAFFLDGSSAQVDYLANYPNIIVPGDAIWDTLYLQQNQAGTAVGTLTYDPSAHTISYNRGGGASTEVMLSGVYRSDYVDDTDAGTNPIFRFPHLPQPTLYVSPSVPNFLVVEFLMRIAAPTSTNPNPINIPVKLMYQLNAITN